jgi:hypothetical protein
MTRFQTAIVILAAAFLALLVYDRVSRYRHEVEVREAARQKEIYDGLQRCEDAVAYPYDHTPQAEAIFNDARKGCRDFWLPQLSKNR